MLQEREKRKQAEMALRIQASGVQIYIDADEIKFDAPRKELGRGSFGACYRSAEGGFAGTTVAVKLLLDTTDLVELEQEAKMLSLLRFDNIVQFRGLTKIDGQHGIVTEFCNLGDLRGVLTGPSNLQQNNIHDAIRNAIRNDPAVGLHAVQNIAAGLHFLHMHGIMHGDLKPANVLVVEAPMREYGFRAKIADFGGSVCHTNVAAGFSYSPHYAAPELLTNRRIEPSDAEKYDMYSFGVTASEVLREAEFRGLGSSASLSDSGSSASLSTSFVTASEVLREAQLLPGLGLGGAPNFDNAYMEKLRRSGKGMLVGLLLRCCSQNPTNRPTFREITEACKGSSAQATVQAATTRSNLQKAS